MAIVMRDAKNPEGGVIPLTSAAWSRVKAFVCEGQFQFIVEGVLFELTADGGWRISNGSVTLIFTRNERLAFAAGVLDGDFK
jgi:hypothetical protein